jgi:hypothetical protein
VKEKPTLRHAADTYFFEYDITRVSWTRRFKFRHVRKIAKRVYLHHFRPSVRMEQLCSHWMDFYKNFTFEYFSKTVENIKVF